jgi:hypothetical protein
MTTLGVVNFCEIDIDALITGKRYIIQENSHQHTRTIYGKFDNYFNPHTTCWSSTTYTVISYCRSQHFYQHTLQLNNMIKKATFYKMMSSKTKIQNAMEMRALNLILKRIIGDCTFVY